MGDRGNIYVVDKDPEHGIYLYSHWEGGDLPRLLGEVLRTPDARGRWDDAPYLTRIVCTALFGSVTGPLGFGVSTYLTDNEHPITILDLRGRVPVVWFAEEGAEQVVGEWFAPHDAVSTAPLNYPKEGGYWRAALEEGEPWKYEATEQAARSWVGDDGGRVQRWDGYRWADA